MTTDQTNNQRGEPNAIYHIDCEETNRISSDEESEIIERFLCAESATQNARDISDMSASECVTVHSITNVASTPQIPNEDTGNRRPVPFGDSGVVAVNGCGAGGVCCVLEYAIGSVGGIVGSEVGGDTSVNRP